MLGGEWWCKRDVGVVIRFRFVCIFGGWKLWAWVFVLLSFEVVEYFLEDAWLYEYHSLFLYFRFRGIGWYTYHVMSC